MKRVLVREPAPSHRAVTTDLCSESAVSRLPPIFREWSPPALSEIATGAAAQPVRAIQGPTGPVDTGFPASAGWTAGVQYARAVAAHLAGTTARHAHCDRVAARRRAARAASLSLGARSFAEEPRLVPLATCKPRAVGRSASEVRLAHTRLHRSAATTATGSAASIIIAAVVGGEATGWCALTRVVGRTRGEVASALQTRTARLDDAFTTAAIRVTAGGVGAIRFALARVATVAKRTLAEAAFAPARAAGAVRLPAVAAGAVRYRSARASDATFADCAPPRSAVACVDALGFEVTV